MKRWVENRMVLVALFGMSLCTCLAQNSCETGFYTYMRCGGSAAVCFYDGDYMRMSFQNQYFTKEMMTEELSYYHVRRRNCFSAFFSHDGFARYGEFSAKVGYGRCFGQRVAVALQAVYLLNHAESYASVHSFTVNIASLCRLTDKCALAVELYNPVHLHYGVIGGEVIPMQLDLRFLYSINSQLIACLYAHQTLPGKLDVGINGIWQPHPNLMLDVNFSNRRLQAGVHVPFRRLIAAVSFQWHYFAGFSPQCQLLVKF